MGGKIKTVSYIVAAGTALLASSLLRLGWSDVFYRWSAIAAIVVFTASVIISVVSFIDYFIIFLKNSEKK
jgi:phosphatidylglycerophosphate synthase